eukprot:scaffold7360_cov270-Pinguiococcus_pyrenoidosus.AAC.5
MAAAFFLQARFCPPALRTAAPKGFASLLWCRACAVSPLSLSSYVQRRRAASNLHQPTVDEESACAISRW